MDWNSRIGRLIAFAVAAILLAPFLTGCAGMSARDTGILAGAATGAERNRTHPVTGAVIGGVIGGLGGLLYQNRIAPVIGDDQASGYRGRPNPYGSSGYGGQYGDLTNCNTRFERDYVSNRVPPTRVKTCSSNRTEQIPGGTVSCRGRYVERQIGNEPPVVQVDNESCTESFSNRVYRAY